MLTEDVAKLKEIIRGKKKNKKYQEKFAYLVDFDKRQQTISQKFAVKFPKITYLMEMEPHNYSFQSVFNSFISNATTNKSGNEQSSEINRQDEGIFRQNYKNAKNLPALNEVQEIKRICDCFSQITQQDFKSDVYEKLYELYSAKGGSKNFDQLKQKIQSDVLFLVKRQKQKLK